MIQLVSTFAAAAIAAMQLAAEIGGSPSIGLQADASNYTKFNLPTASATVQSMVLAPDGNVWFTEKVGKVGKISPFGEITEYPVCSDDCQPFGITVGPDGLIWFTEYNASHLTRLNADYTTTRLPLAPYKTYPAAVVTGPDGNLWVAATGSITKVTQFGITTIYDDGGKLGFPYSITVGADGNIWFADFNNNQIGRVTTSGQFTLIPTPSGSASAIIRGPDDKIWYGAFGHKIGRVESDLSLTEFDSVYSPIAMTAGPDGAIWFKLLVGGYGRLTVAGLLTDLSTSGGSTLTGGIAAGSDRTIWYSFEASSIARAFPPSSSYAATLPSSRSVQVGGTATAFATILSLEGGSACRPSLLSSIPADFSYQTTSSTTNAAVGNPNEPVTLQPGGSQTFVVAFKTKAPFPQTDVALSFACADHPPALPIVGVNTLTLVFDQNPVADMIAVGLTPSNDGYARLTGASPAGFFAVAAANIGVSSQLTARPRVTGNVGFATATICETTPSNGVCKSPASASVSRPVLQNETSTWTVFIKSTGAVPTDAATNRVFLEFLDSNGIVRGSTSTAVTTQAAGDSVVAGN